MLITHPSMICLLSLHLTPDSLCFCVCAACREGEIFCRHPGAHCIDHGDPVGLCLHRDGASHSGERTRTAPCGVFVAAQR